MVNPIKLFFFVFMFLLAIPLATAAQPSVQVSVGDNTGFEIRYLIFPSIRQNEDFEFEFHVYNKSNGFPIIDGISCDFHLYNGSDNTHLIDNMQATATVHTYDYTFNVNGSNFTEPGTYSYLIGCNDSRIGGFASAQFEVTPSGRLKETQNYYIPIIMFILGMAALLVWLAYMLKEEHIILSIIFLFGVLILFLIGAGFILNVSKIATIGEYEASTIIQSAMNNLYYFTIILFIVVMIYTFLYLLVLSLQSWQDNEGERYL